MASWQTIGERTNNDGREPALLRRPSIQARTGLSKTTLYRLMKAGEFPRPVVIAKRAVAWRAADLSDWLASVDARAAVQS
jgi:prophage regulatory protein